jgi:multiple antibiotic resistance protein
MEMLFSFINLVFVGFVALFPPVNPLGTALTVDPLLHGLDLQQRRSAAREITFYCLMICTGTTLIGSWLFKVFGISLPVVQIAGGILICKMGWQLLSPNGGSGEAVALSPSEGGPTAFRDVLFYPIAFPMTTGAGTISVLLTLSAHGHATVISVYLINLLALMVTILLMCLLIFLSYAYTPTLLRRLG